MQMNHIEFPPFSGIRCLMMPYIQGDPASVPDQFRRGYESILASTFLKWGDVGYLTIDESPAQKGIPHRGARARWGRAIHTEAGRHPDMVYAWGGGGWGSGGGTHRVTLDGDVMILLANNIDNSCAIWNAEHPNTSTDGDIGDCADQCPYADAVFMQAGVVHKIGILTPHESLPIMRDVDRQFLRIVGSGVHGREPYFTENPLL